MSTSNQTTNIYNNTMMGPHSTNALDAITLATGPAQTYTVSSGQTGTAGSVLTANGSWSQAPTLEVGQSGIIELRGKNADIRVNGESLMETLKGIQDRLNMLRPDPELEAEWDQLRELGEQYRKLEAEFKEKTKMWNALKK